MNRNKNTNKRSVLIVSLSIIILLLIGACIYLYLDNRNNLKVPTNTEATNIANQVYLNAYDKVLEGQSLVDDSKEYTKSDARSNSLKCHKLDFSTIANIFTEKGLEYIKSNYSDTVLGDGSDNNYYTCWLPNDEYPYINTKIYGLMNSIFGVTDQAERSLTVVAATSDTIIATGQLKDADRYPLYIIFKKVNNKWLIDSFE